MDDIAGFNVSSVQPEQERGQTPFFTPRVITALLVCFIALLTRFLTNDNSKSKSVDNGKAQTVPAVPYWAPIIGHLPNMALNADSFVKGLRNRFSAGLFALNFGGYTHNIIFSPGHVTALLNSKDSNVSFYGVARKIMCDVFGFPRSELDKYDAAYEEIAACYRHLQGEPGLGNMVKITAAQIKTNVQNFVSFSPSLVDQTYWERVSNINVTKNNAGQDVVEASFLPLVRDFCSHSANPSLVGTNFLTNYPDFFDDIWTFDRGFLLLAAGLPRWLPIPILTRAHIARKRLLDRLTTFHSALEAQANGSDPGPDWRDLDDIGDLVRARIPIYRKHNWSLRARASTELALLWATNANSNSLIFWMLNHIYADGDLLTAIRAETAPYATPHQPAQEFPIPEPPRLSNLDIDALCAHCPLLKAVYIECLRLDTASWSLRHVQNDFHLTPRDSKPPNTTRPYLLPANSYAHAAHDLHNTDPKAFPDPLEFRPERHIRYDAGTGAMKSAELGTLRPYGGGASMCKGRAFALKECMGFVAAVVAMWEVERKGGGGEWVLPGHRKATGVYGTGEDVRVWVRRRDLGGGE
ncbi:hypothetical protein MBLNU230_g2699t1 [Neophaeotheca triangularis]